MVQTLYFAGRCLWGVQAYVKTLKGVIHTEGGRANGTSNTLEREYDGYAECVKTEFYTEIVSVASLYIFQIGIKPLIF